MHKSLSVSNTLCLSPSQLFSGTNRTELKGFYQSGSRASYASAGNATAGMSVRPPVCPSHSGIISKQTITITWLTESPKTQKDSPQRGLMRLGWVQIGDFQPLSRRIADTVQEDQRCQLSLTESRIRAFDWFQNHWPWMTLYFFTR